MRMMHIHASLLDIEFIFMHGIKSKEKIRDREREKMSNNMVKKNTKTKRM